MTGFAELALRVAADAVLLPIAAVAPARGAEHDLGVALDAMPRDDRVVIDVDLAEPRSGAVERQADGVEYRRLARAGGADERENPIAAKGWGVEVDAPFAVQRVEIAEAEFEYFHGESFA